MNRKLCPAGKSVCPQNKSYCAKCAHNFTPFQRACAFLIVFFLLVALLASTTSCSRRWHSCPAYGKNVNHKPAGTWQRS